MQKITPFLWFDNNAEEAPWLRGTAGPASGPTGIPSRSSSSQFRAHGWAANSAAARSSFPLRRKRKHVSIARMFFYLGGEHYAE